MDNTEYEEIEATIRVPKGTNLARSRKTAGAHRGFARDPDTKKLSHAEIFLKEGNCSDTPTDAQPLFFSNTNEPVSDSKARDRLDPEEVAEVLILLAETAVKVAPHLKKWWNHQALPFAKSARQKFSRTRKNDPQSESDESSTLIESAATEYPHEAAATPAEHKARMSSTEARERFFAALLARALSENAKLFSEEQMRLLLHAQIEDEHDALDLKSVKENLKPEQVEERINLILEANPALLDQLVQILMRNRKKDGDLQLKSGDHQSNGSD